MPRLLIELPTKHMVYTRYCSLQMASKALHRKILEDIPLRHLQQTAHGLILGYDALDFAIAEDLGWNMIDSVMDLPRRKRWVHPEDRTEKPEREGETK